MVRNLTFPHHSIGTTYLYPHTIHAISWDEQRVARGVEIGCRESHLATLGKTMRHTTRNGV